MTTQRADYLRRAIPRLRKRAIPRYRPAVSAPAPSPLTSEEAERIREQFTKAMADGRNAFRARAIRWPDEASTLAQYMPKASTFRTERI